MSDKVDVFPTTSAVSCAQQPVDFLLSTQTILDSDAAESSVRLNIPTSASTVQETCQESSLGTTIERDASPIDAKCAFELPTHALLPQVEHAFHQLNRLHELSQKLLLASNENYLGLSIDLIEGPVDMFDAALLKAYTALKQRQLQVISELLKLDVSSDEFPESFRQHRRLTMACVSTSITNLRSSVTRGVLLLPKLFKKHVTAVSRKSKLDLLCVYKRPLYLSNNSSEIILSRMVAIFEHYRDRSRITDSTSSTADKASKCEREKRKEEKVLDQWLSPDSKNLLLLLSLECQWLALAINYLEVRERKTTPSSLSSA